MAQLAELNAVTLDHPNDRIIHITNDDTARVLRREAMLRAPDITKSFEDYDELKHEINSIRHNPFVGRHLQHLEAMARTVASAPTVELEGVTFGLGGLASVSKHNAVAGDAKHTIFVFENGIDAKGFGRFFSFYSGCEARLMPTIVVAAKSGVPDLLQKLSPLANKFRLEEHYRGVAKRKPPSSSAPLSISEMLSEFAANNFLSVSNSNFSLASVDVSDFASVVQGLSAAYTVIRSIHFEHNKFRSADMLRQANEIFAKIEPSRLSFDQRRLVGALHVLFKLWSLYVYENDPTELDSALSMSKSLDSDILTAHCLRLMNLSAGYSELSIHSLENAERIFQQNNQDIMAFYCRNNLLLNHMHRVGRVTDDFSHLVEEANIRNPNMFSLINMINNGMVAAILDTRYDKALEFWHMARNYNASPIHRFGLDLNAFICRFVQGDVIKDVEFDAYLRSIIRNNLPRGYGYHQTILLFNVREMQRRLGYSTELAESILLEKMFMPYDEVVSGHKKLQDFLVERLPTTLPQGHYSGQRGAFINQTNLIPVIHFGWM